MLAELRFDDTLWSRNKAEVFLKESGLHEFAKYDRYGQKWHVYKYMRSEGYECTELDFEEDGIYVKLVHRIGNTDITSTKSDYVDLDLESVL